MDESHDPLLSEMFEREDNLLDEISELRKKYEELEKRITWEVTQEPKKVTIARSRTKDCIDKILPACKYYITLYEYKEDGQRLEYKFETPFLCVESPRVIVRVAEVSRADGSADLIPTDIERKSDGD